MENKESLMSHTFDGISDGESDDDHVPFLPLDEEGPTDSEPPKHKSWYIPLFGGITFVIVLILYLFLFGKHDSTKDDKPGVKFSKNMKTCPLGTKLNITRFTDGTLAPSPPPRSHAMSDGEKIIELFQNLGRSTVWKSIANITMEGDSFEPEGIVRLGEDRYIVSAGEYTEHPMRYADEEIIDGTDRTAGHGFAHLIVYDGKGRRLADATITEEHTEEYHNGGLDYDGEQIWGTIAQYRPNSTAYIYRASLDNLEPKSVVRLRDHLGTIIPDPQRQLVTALNWGSRNASTWQVRADSKTGCDAEEEPWKRARNPSYFVDYQDCKWLGYSAYYKGRSVALCSGVATVGDYVLGGIALVDVHTMKPLAEVPITLESELGVRMTMNPMDVSVVDEKLRFYWMPDQRNSTLYIYEAQPDSPFQYGGGLVS